MRKLTVIRLLLKVAETFEGRKEIDLSYVAPGTLYVDSRNPGPGAIGRVRGGTVEDVLTTLDELRLEQSEIHGRWKEQWMYIRIRIITTRCSSDISLPHQDKSARRLTGCRT